MHVLHLQSRCLILATVVCLACRIFVVASDEPTLSKEQITQFLLTAKVVKGEHTKKGITEPWRLTLTDGNVTHDASFQAIDEHKQSKQLASGTEFNFVDSYKYNIAAYQLAELLGLDDLVPVYVERKWKGDTGSLSWWLPVKMDEVERARIALPFALHIHRHQVIETQQLSQLIGRNIVFVGIDEVEFGAAGELLRLFVLIDGLERGVVGHVAVRQR